MKKQLIIAGIIGSLLLSFTKAEANEKRIELETYPEIAACLDDREAKEERRIIVESDKLVQDDHAIAVYHLEPTGETALEYASKEEANAAYLRLAKDYTCYKDKLIHIDCQEEDTSLNGETADMGSCLRLLGIEELQKKKMPNAVTVAVIDLGFDARHEMIRGKLSPFSYDFNVDPHDLSVDPHDLKGKTYYSVLQGHHGTEVASVIAQATPDNTDILACLIGSTYNPDFASISQIRTAFNYCMDCGADVINLSIDWTEKRDFVEDLVEKAYEKGIIVCAASGNEASQISENLYPQSLEKVVTVGAVALKEGKAEWWLDEQRNGEIKGSNYGKQIDFSAPGANIPVAYDSDKEIADSGTSFSSPFIASCFAYLKGYYPNRSTAYYINALKNTCVDYGVKGKDVYYGWGIPDLSSENSPIVAWQNLPEQEKHIYARTVVSKATCTEPGQVSYQCQECDDHYSKEILPGGHQWDTDTENVNILIKKCQICGYEDPQTYSQVENNKYLLGQQGDVKYYIQKPASGKNNEPWSLYVEGKGEIIQSDQYPWKDFAAKIELIVISDNISNIPDEMFSSMPALERVVLPDSMIEIGKKAFYRCQKLGQIQLRLDGKVSQTLSLGNSLMEIGDGAFAGCRALKKIQIQEENPYYKSVEDANGYSSIYNKRMTTLYFLNLHTGHIEDTVTKITPYACYGNMELEHYTVSEDVSIKEYAFKDCMNLSSIYFSMDKNKLEQLELISQCAFENVVADAYYTGERPDSYGGSFTWIEEREKTMLSVHNTEIQITGSTVYDLETPKVEPAFTVKCADKTLGADDYAYYFYNNDKAGRAYLTIIGQGQYTGRMTKSFTISKKGIDIQKNVVEPILAEQAEKGHVDLRPYARKAIKFYYVDEKDHQYPLVYKDPDSEKLIWTYAFQNFDVPDPDRDCKMLCGKHKFVARIEANNPYYKVSTSIESNEFELTIPHSKYGEYVEEEEVTCQEDGRKGYWICEACEQIFIEENGSQLVLENEEDDNLIIPVIFGENHKYQEVYAKASLTKSGYKADKCSVCKNVKNKTTYSYPKTITLSKTAFVYNGKIQKPVFTVKGADGKTIASKNYTVSIPSSLKVGSYKAKITFKGNYTGTKTITYKMNPKPTTIVKVIPATKAFTPYWTKITAETSGYQIEYATSAKFTDKKSLFVNKNTTVSSKISKLLARKKYYVRIRTYKTVSGTKYYSSWSPVKTVITK